MNDTKYRELAGSIVSWIQDYFSSAGMTGTVVGLSGGIDSGVTAALCARALGRENVLGLIMPCESIKADTEDGHRTAEHLGIPSREIDLTGALEAMILAGNLNRENRLELANVKARLRMTTEYALARGKLVAGTGNLSETVTGYWTKWGDGAADFMPLAELWKDEVRELGRYLGLPDWILSRVPSGGLWEGQSDESEMGVTYTEIKKYHVEGKESVPSAAAVRIEQLYRSSAHKRNPIPYFKAREIMDGKQKKTGSCKCLGQNRSC